MMTHSKIILGGLAGLLLWACEPQSEMQGQILNEAGANETVSSGQSNEATEATEIIAVTRSGNPAGRTIVLIPGLASSPAVWNETRIALQDYDLRLVHLAGFAGRGAARWEKDSFIDSVSEAIAAHLSDIPGQDTVIIGHSLGGFTGLKMALIADADISELIIVDSLPYLSEMMMPGVPPENTEAMANMLSQQMKVMSRENYDRQQETGVVRLAKSTSYHDDILSWSKTSDQETVALAMGELLSADLREEIRTLPVKTTVLAAWDPMMGVEKAQIQSLFENQYSKMPDHKIIIIDNSYHFIMFDQFDHFIKVVKTELE